MKIFDEKWAPVESPDLEKGWLETQRRVVKHHPEVYPSPAVTHPEIIPGTDGLRRLVIDAPAVKGSEAWDECEEIQVYHTYTPEELEGRSKPTEIEQLRADVDFLAAMGGVQL